MRVALFGGSFNPPHVGHLLAVAYLRAVAPVDAVWLMPAHRHAFGKQLAPWEDRLQMCGAVASVFTGVEVTDIEAHVPGEGRTVDTVDALRARYPTHTFRLVLGTDLLEQLPRWKDPQRLLALAPPLVVGRTGYPKPDKLPDGAEWLGDVFLPEVSSTQVRAALAGEDDIEALVPAAVRRIIEERALYRVSAAT